MGKQWKMSEHEKQMEHLSDLGELLRFMTGFVWTIRGVLWLISGEIVSNDG